jgi:hypothetical protein
MRIELFTGVVQKSPPKVKLSWILGRGYQKTSLKNTFRDDFFKPPPPPPPHQKIVIKNELLEVVV